MPKLNRSVVRPHMFATCMAAALVACGGGGSDAPAAAPAAKTLTGTWVGPGNDSTGPGTMTLNLVQNGVAVSGDGTVCTPGGNCISISKITATGSDAINFSGTMNGSFTTCTITIDFKAVLAEPKLNGTYTGTNSCSGPFTNGTLSLQRK